MGGADDVSYPHDHPAYAWLCASRPALSGTAAAGIHEHLADLPSKGDRVMVTGRLRQRSWETPEGEKRSVTELEVEEVGAR